MQGRIPETIFRKFHFFTLPFLLAAGDIAAQQSAWPENWHILPPGGGDKVFRLEEDTATSTRVLNILTNNDAGSLLIDFDMPLTEQTTVQWRWNVQDIPSEVAENTDKTHDYLALAIMFDNDQVMSYIWSASLPIGTVFQCPLPRWQDRETHLVLHSGAAQLGQWLSEERHLLQDYSRYKQGALPKAIKQVWFIAGSRSQGGSGAASFSDASLGDQTNGRQYILSQPALW